MKISDYTKRRKPGRPRSEKSHQAILQATRDMLIELGVHELTIEGVAERAGVGKATIYRHWKSKEDLMAEALGSIADEIEIPNTGDAIHDFATVLDDMLKVANDAAQSSPTVLKRLMAGLLESPVLMNIYKEKFIRPRREVLNHIIKRGIEAGQIRPDVNIEHLIDIISGSYMYNLFINDESIHVHEWLEKIKPIMRNGITPEGNEDNKIFPQ